MITVNIPHVTLQILPALDAFELPEAPYGEIVKEWTPLAQVFIASTSQSVFEYSLRRGNHAHEHLTIRVHMQMSRWQRLVFWLARIPAFTQ